MARGLRGVTRMRTVCVHGGAARAPQHKALQVRPTLLVATPGRLLDLLDSGALALGAVTPPVHAAVRDPVRVTNHSNGHACFRTGFAVVSACCNALLSLLICQGCTLSWSARFMPADSTVIR